MVVMATSALITSSALVAPSKRLVFAKTTVTRWTYKITTVAAHPSLASHASLRIVIIHVIFVIILAGRGIFKSSWWLVV